MTQTTDGVSSPRPTLVPGGGGGTFPQGRIDDDPEELVVLHDRASGLHAVVSIQSTVLGPALGGCRFHPYGSMVDAVDDAVARGVSGIGDTLAALFTEADREGITPSMAADRLARRRIEERLAHHELPAA